MDPFDCARRISCLFDFRDLFPFIQARPRNMIPRERPHK
jgi:hypothetical protein